MKNKSLVLACNKILDLDKVRSSQRVLIGITGPPGAGKSTFSAKLEAFLNDKYAFSVAKVVPMDGFHYSNQILFSMGLEHLKGIPDSFDKEAFCDLIEKLKYNESNVQTFPLFDRSREICLEDADMTTAAHKFILVEGNYLLTWHRMRNYLDFVLYLDVDENILLNRLLERHISLGKNKEQALEKVRSTDLPNAKLVKSTMDLADLVLTESVL